MRKNCEMERILSLISLFLFYVALIVHMVSFSLGHPLICSSHDSLALLQFKQSLVVADYPQCNDRNKEYYYDKFHCGSSYPKTMSWNRTTDCCSWDGVTCDWYTGHVIGLDLRNSKLEGTLHPNSSLFQLSHLQILDLSANDFLGSQIPQGIGHLVSLKHLNLSNSFLQGRIPLEISYMSKLVSLDLSDVWESSLHLSEEGLDMLFHNLTKLEVLSLSFVNISSKIPMNVSSSSLRYLDLEGTNLRGVLPQSIFLLPNLETLRLQRNYITGSLPKFNWSSSHSLTELDLSDNYISGRLPGSLGSLKSLTIARLDGCNLMGPIPENIRNLSQITQLSLSHNHLEGKIPDVFSNLQKLRLLELGENAFIGLFPASLVNLTMLELLDLENNSLSGPLPLTANGLQNLGTLYLRENTFNGSIPSWMFSLPSLIGLDLFSNHFSGPLPEFKTNSLEYLGLFQNELHGPIPQSLRDLVNLTELDLGENKLSGEVRADMFSRMKYLQILDLSGSGLSWSSSKDNITFPHLYYLGLGFCGVKDFPNFLSNSKELWYLDLSVNEIQGQFPKWFEGLSSLRFLNLSHNKLTSLDHVPWQSMEVFDLQSNSLTGLLPSSLCTSSNLEVLDFSNNHLSTEIPNCLFTSTKLQVLDLRANNFHGPIPNNFPKYSGLVHISLRENQLEGPIPRSLINCTYLRFLDLGSNKIHDTFPTWLEMLQELEILILKSNRFYGPIGGLQKKSPFLKLRIFDLSGNSFTGSLPYEVFKGFKAMMNVDFHKSKLEYMEESVESNYFGSYEESMGLVMKNHETELKKINMMFTAIDLSKNKFEGEIPKFIGNLKSLRHLNLSHNNLTGHIPVEIKNMSALEALDLSFNQLTGRIPAELTSLTFLEVLNMSYNHLVGPIPRSNQFITFSNDSYVGNPGLCGPPLSNECGYKSAPPIPPLVEQEDDEPSFVSEITLSSVLIGYGCGLVFGLTTLYFIYRYERPRWFIVFLASITPGNPYRAKRRGQRCQNFLRRGH